MKTIIKQMNPAETFDDVSDMVRAAELLAEVYGRYDITGQGMVPPEIEPVRDAFIETCRALKSVMRRYSRNVSKIIEAARTKPEEDTPEQDTSRTRAGFVVYEAERPE
jgi:hypothetical protein